MQRFAFVLELCVGFAVILRSGVALISNIRRLLKKFQSLFPCHLACVSPIDLEKGGNAIGLPVETQSLALERSLLQRPPSVMRFKWFLIAEDILINFGNCRENPEWQTGSFNILTYRASYGSFVDSVDSVNSKADFHGRKPWKGACRFKDALRNRLVAILCMWFLQVGAIK